MAEAPTIGWIDIAMLALIALSALAGAVRGLTFEILSLLGWVAAWFVGPIMDGAGVGALVLLIVGGALYSIGGVLYAMKWPDPWPTTFGHHEFFHACTAVAAICHYIAMWFAVF
jgi:hemolysin III